MLVFILFYFYFECWYLKQLKVSINKDLSPISNAGRLNRLVTLSWLSSQTVSAKSISSVATSGFIMPEMTARKCGPGFESKLGMTQMKLTQILKNSLN